MICTYMSVHGCEEKTTYVTNRHVVSGRPESRGVTLGFCHNPAVIASHVLTKRDNRNILLPARGFHQHSKYTLPKSYLHAVFRAQEHRTWRPH